MNSRRTWLWLVCSFAVACGTPPAPSVDAGPEDAGQHVVDASVELRFLGVDGGEVTQVHLDDAVVVRATGLQAGTTVQLMTTMGPWISVNAFPIGEDGTLDTSRHAPSSGSYSGVDVDGPVWSMDSASYAFASSADLTFTLLLPNGSNVERRLARVWGPPADAQRVQPPASIRVVGELVLPAGPGPFPTLLAFGGSEGGLGGGQGYRDELVRQGYGVFAIAYFGAPGVPNSLVNVPLEYFDRALDWLEQQPKVDAQHVGVIGASRGGELALLLSTRRPELRAVVAEVPSAYVWGGLQPRSAAWTVGGVGLASLQDTNVEPIVVSSRFGDALELTPIFEAAIAQASPSSLADARIPVENSSASIALYAGAMDQLWPSCTMAHTVWSKLETTGHTAQHADELHCFEDTGHALSVLGYPTTWATAVPVSSVETLAMGGTPVGIAHASRLRQAKLRAFLQRTLGP